MLIDGTGDWGFKQGYSESVRKVGLGNRGIMTAYETRAWEEWKKG